MGTALVIGNGDLLVNIDHNLQLTDLYFPHVGQENHLALFPNKMFFRINCKFYELNSENFNFEIKYRENSMVADSLITHKLTGLQCQIIDFVVPTSRIYFRKFYFVNNSSNNIEVTVYFQNNFTIFETDIGDTCLWYQKAKCLIHYKKNRYIGVGSTEKIYQFTCAARSDNNGNGAYPDIETGEMYLNPISNGSVNSCISYKYTLEPNQSAVGDIYTVAGFSFNEVEKLTKYVRSKKFETLLEESENTWIDWSRNFFQNKKYTEDMELNKKINELYNKSQMIIKTQIDNHGAILAANDGRFLKNGGKDTYSYFWPRDGAYIALSLIESNESDLVRNYINYAKKLISDEGYFLHKYYPYIEDNEVGLASSWHPWVDKTGKSQLPIQEDETALNLYVVNEYFKKFGDREFIESLWDKYIFPMANFLGNYRFTLDYDVETIEESVSGYKTTSEDDFNAKYTHSKLPRPSYDLWEERKGINTFTCVTVFAGLKAGAEIARKLGKIQYANAFDKFAEEVKTSTIEHLYNPELRRFISGIKYNEHSQTSEPDNSVDSSLYSIWHFGMLEVTDERVEQTMDAIISRLTVNTPIQGIARRENDYYLRFDDSTQGNPWFISTLWVAQYYIQINKLEKAIEYIKWVVDHTDYTGLMAEQAHPHTGKGESVKPLSWSHSEFVRTLNMLAEKLKK